VHVINGHLAEFTKTGESCSILQGEYELSALFSAILAISDFPHRVQRACATASRSFAARPCRDINAATGKVPVCPQRHVTVTVSPAQEVQSDVIKAQFTRNALTIAQFRRLRTEALTKLVSLLQSHSDLRPIVDLRAQCWFALPFGSRAIICLTVGKIVTGKNEEAMTVLSFGGERLQVLSG
jgi:hypothetical protein